MGDPYNIQNASVSTELSNEEREFCARSVSPHIELKPGWGGMGLRGNHSFASLTRPTSVGSGLFLEESDDEGRSSDQVAGEVTRLKRKSSLDEAEKNGRYVKTTTMANFYYRKIGSTSQENLGSKRDGPFSPDKQRSQSDAAIEK